MAEKVPRLVWVYCMLGPCGVIVLGFRQKRPSKRPKSPRHVTGDDFLLGNLKFIPKGKKDEVFGMPIPKELIRKAIRKSEYYKQYMEMVARKVQAKEDGKKKTAPKADKPVKPAPAKRPKPLIDEDEEVHHEPEPQGKGEDYDLNRAIQMSLETFQAHGQAPIGGVVICEPVAEATRQLLVVEGKGKAIATDEQTTQSLLDLHKPKKRSTTDQFIFQRRTPTTIKESTGPSVQPQDDTSVNIVRNTLSPADAETGADTDITTSTTNTEVWKSIRYGVSIQVLDTAYWGFLRVGTKLDIFQNIHILFLEYGVLSLSGYSVLSINPLWSLVSAGTDMPYLP
ncbi:hypothetical protein Tco_0856577 [Tanacetum coccineum]|uniref:Uncharacterized protein n=1 Tax=Tanacetum coccineum TaxID=301880 RepID=A0ABQ5B468_9ASTR